MRSSSVIVLLVAVAGCLSAGPASVGPAPGAGSSDVPGDAIGDPTFLELGRWLPTFDAEVAAVHATLLGDGRVLFWSVEAAHTPGGVFVESPENGRSRVLEFSRHEALFTTPTPEDGGATDLFCSGQTYLPDGRVVAFGGSAWSTLRTPTAPAVAGTKDVRIFDPATGTWTQGPQMERARWYPSVLAVPDGRILVASGYEDPNNANSQVRGLEAFSADGTLERLPESADRSLPMYPRLVVVPSGPLAGDVFYQPAGCLWCPGGLDAGELAWNQAQSLDLETMEWATHGRPVLGVRNAPMVTMLPLRPPAYDAKLLVAGGTLQRTGGATATVETTDLSTEPPTHALAPSMAFPRWFGNSVLLPDGQVLAVGGSRYDGVETLGLDSYPAAHVLQTEVYDPESGAWSRLADMTVPRVYHSTALLLPDARVMVGGSVPIDLVGTGHEHTGLEVFEPPYLFRGARPAIAAAPESAAYGEAFEVLTPDASRIGSVVMVRPGSVTHIYNPEQRLVELVVEDRGADRLVVRAPPDAALAPPGPWMLFLNAETEQGPVPSVARFVRLG